MYYINYFFIYSFLGYLYECFLGLIKDDKVGSGILYGPVTPVYGVGALFILIVSKFIFDFFKLSILIESIIIAIIMAIILKVSIIEWIILVLLIGAVLAAETINTTIKNFVDMYTKEYDEKAKIVKDTAAGTVLILAITSAIIGLIIFIPKIIYLLESL